MDGGLTLKIDQSEFEKTFGQIVQNLENPTEAYQIAGAIARESIRYNFNVGGRPTHWEPSKRGTRLGIPGKRASTLRVSNRLMNSFTVKASKNGVRVGTNVVYAAVHHFGAKKGSFGTKTFSVRAHTRTRGSKQYGVRAHQRKVALPWGDIPARPFAMLQVEDVTEIQKVLANNITQGA